MQTTCKKSSSSAAEIVANIEDLLSQILLRLPARSVYRFQCVSKRWLSLISDPKFHQLRNPKSKISALLPSTTEESYFNTTPLDNVNYPPPSQVINPYKFLDQSLLCQHDSTCQILQSCNGLLLCTLSCGKSNECCWDTCSSTVCVVNPTTNQFSALSYPRVEVESHLDQLDVYFGLAFDPSRSPHYKVVCINVRRREHTIDIYSSETQAWKLVEMSEFWPFYYSLMRQGAVYFNGALHWISEPNIPIYADLNFTRDYMQYFDVDKEESVNCTVFSPPRVMSDTDLDMCMIEYRYFGESGGHLHLIDIYEKSVFQFDVMEMGKDYSGWFVKYHVDLDPVTVTFPEMLHQSSYIAAVVLIVYPEEKEEDSSPQLLLHVPGELISYSIKNKTFEKSSITTGNCFVVKGSSPGYYMESTASVR